MKPAELFDKCMEAINAWNTGEMIAEEPFVMLVVPRKTVPQGRRMRLCGKAGPYGEIATVKQTERGFDVVAYFPAVPIVKMLGEMTGAKVKVRRA